MHLVLDSGIFEDSGIPDCVGEAQLDTGVPPSSHDLALDGIPYDPAADRDGDGALASVDCDDADIAPDPADPAW